jgi:RNA polymerase subunit RPABC4/transcription elongation factor Spt4
MKVDLYKCDKCKFIGTSKVLSCPRCGSKDYKYYSPLRYGK